MISNVRRTHDGDHSRVRVGLLAYGLDRPATGIARYTVEVARSLQARHREIELVLLQPFDHEIPLLNSLERIRLRLVRLLPGLMTFGPAELALAARRHGLAVLHDPVGVAPFIATRTLGGSGTVVTIHDMVPFVHPDTHDRLTNLLFRRYMPITLRFVDKVVTVSDASKLDIQRYYHLDQSRIQRIYCGVGEQFRPQPLDVIKRVLQQYQIRPPYVLCVGALSARKNLETALEAFAILQSRGVGHRLVLVGPKAWKTQGIFQQIERLGLAEQVTFTGFVTDVDLPAIYSGADCFIFPSLYEGFGLPPLEAMASGVPVVASNTSSIPEVTDDAALSVNPRDASGMADAVCRVLSDPKLAEDLRKRGVVQSNRFTWAHAAAEHAELFQQVAVRKARTRK